MEPGTGKDTEPVFGGNAWEGDGKDSWVSRANTAQAWSSNTCAAAVAGSGDTAGDGDQLPQFQESHTEPQVLLLPQRVRC